MHCRAALPPIKYKSCIFFLRCYGNKNHITSARNNSNIAAAGAVDQEFVYIGKQGFLRASSNLPKASLERPQSFPRASPKLRQSKQIPPHWKQYTKRAQFLFLILFLGALWAHFRQNKICKNTIDFVSRRTFYLFSN